MQLKDFQNRAEALAKECDELADAAGSVDNLLETALGSVPWKLRKTALQLRETSDRVAVKYDKLFLKSQA